MKAGFIGYRNFAEKLRKIFEESGHVEEFLFFHPEKCIENLLFTNKLEDLFGSDFIVIASPDWTHGPYLRQLQDYEGYIFCEKIPVMTREDLAFLKNHYNPFLYFDFNYRKSYLFNLIQEFEEKILYINHLFSHGLALKEEYKNNWRSSASKSPLGVFQLSGFHLFDLLVYSFGHPTSRRITANNLSPYGDAIDNFGISLEFQDRIIADLFFSYTSPYNFSFNIITTEVLIMFDGKEVIVRGPRETFDNKGLFAFPSVISQKKLNLYWDSLKKSVYYFLDIVKSKGEFSEALLEKNLLSTELFLDIFDELNN